MAIKHRERSPGRVAELLLIAKRNVEMRFGSAKHLLRAADRFTPRARKVLEAAFSQAKAGIPRTALVLALKKGDSARVEAIVDQALGRFGRSVRRPLVRVLADTMAMSGAATAKTIGKLRVASALRTLVIRKDGDDWCLYTHDGSKKLGCHKTKAEAEAQEKAINIAKSRAAAFNPDQPRDEDGKWTDGGASGGDANSSGRTPQQHFEAADQRYGKLTLKERDVRNTTLPRDDVYSGDTVDGFRVRTDIPNTDSISATFDEDEYEELPGLREVAIDDLGVSDYKSKDDNDRVKYLAEQLKESEEISPLIVVVDSDGPYVLEGNHRARAMKKLGKKKVPALVIVHYDKKLRANSTSVLSVANIYLREDVYAATVNGGHLRVATPKIKGFAFDRTNPRARDWVDEHVGELIDEMSRSTRERVKDLVGRTVDGEFDTHDLADRITELIGDESRAETIARTETMAASNGGQREAWAQAVDDGLLNGDEEEEWITTPDDITCEICQPMDGVKKPLGGQFNVGGELIDGPPAHPRCRCTTALAVKS